MSAHESAIDHTPSPTITTLSTTCQIVQPLLDHDRGTIERPLAGRSARSAGALST